MLSNRVLFPILCGLALVTAHGADGLAVGGRLTDASGAPFAAGVYRLDAAFVTGETAAPIAEARVEVRTDAAGNYVTTLPVSVETLGCAGEALWLRQTFAASDGAPVATLPLQRLGYAPYALQADEADRLATTNGEHGVENLSVRTSLKANTLVVTNRIVSAGVVAVRDVSADRAAAVRIDRLTAGSLGTSLFGRLAGKSVVGERGDLLQIDGIAAAGEGLFELTLTTEGADGLTAVVRRTPKEGVAETVCSLSSVETAGTTRRVLTAPVRAGDVLSVTASCGESGRVTAAYDFIYFGTSNGDASPEGENK